MTNVPPTITDQLVSPYDAAIRADRLSLLFRQSFPALFLSLLIACIMCWTLWGSVSPHAAYAWISVLSVSTLIRLIMFLRYFEASPQGPQILAWERPYAVTLMLSSLIWGLGALYLIHECKTMQQGIVLFFLAGMLGGSMVTYASHRVMTICAMSSVMLPSTLWLYIQPGQAALGMAIASTVMMATAFLGTKVLSNAMQSSLLLSYQLQHARDIAENMARTDALTGIFNRRAFVECGAQAIRLCERNAHPVSILLIDIDFFKHVNDTHGHGAGDLVLKKMGHLLESRFRKTDICGRFGGEEFAVLLPNTEVAAAKILADKFRQAVADTAIPWQTENLGVTISIGVAADSYDLESLLQRADMAMYQAKASGRNAMVCF
ncbi:GGDEF domain-containing protein [Herbaspirillum rhizosphaerae]|uniref:GGDEF domain-containing protein n=1 Tax=Herbaspirillum rhizosphaerae TaxID=346179 RepID=UPI00067C09BD|nr:diguanylate cyclase [Herbaspirillum rhizosphaerae]